MTNTKEIEREITLICPNCEQDITYYYKRGIKDGRKQLLDKFEKMIDEFLKNGNYTKEGLVIFGNGNIKELKQRLKEKGK